MSFDPFRSAGACTCSASACGQATVENGSRVDFIVRMPLRAVRFYSHVAATLATSHVFCMGDWLKMLGVNAEGYSALVVQFQSIGDWSNVKLVRHDMGGFISVIADSNVSVPAGYRSKPNPASRFRHRYAKIQQSFKKSFGILFASHRDLPQVTLVRAVQRLRDTVRPVSIIGPSQFQGFQKLNKN